MDIKEYLINDRTINRSELARRMWPGNKKLESYLSSKLAGMRDFTRKDAENALKVLQQLAQELMGLSINPDHPDPVPEPRKKLAEMV